jgi:hypothetical protein
MDITIGVQHVARDISLESEESAEAIATKVAEAINTDGLLSLTDSKGRVVLVPGSKIAYVDLGPAAGRRVGFGK